MQRSDRKKGNFDSLASLPKHLRCFHDFNARLRVKNASFNSLVTGLEARAESKRQIVDRYAFWGLVVLVAIPLPGTGAWTGALVAAMMRMRLRRAFPAIVLGVIIAAVIVSVITYGARMVF